MNRYYKFHVQADYKYMGAYPQLKLKDYSRENFLHSIDPGELLDSSIIFDFFKLSPRSKRTDFMTCSHIGQAIGLIISKKVKRILEELLSQGGKFTPHRFFPVTADGLKENEYFYFELIHDHEIIDFENCTFEDITDDDKVVKIKSIDEYLPYFLPLEIKLNSAYDMFKIPFDTKIFVSDRLREIFKNESLTGYEELFEYKGYKIIG